MGSWSHEPFGNDTAADWAYGLVKIKDLSHIEAALDKVLGNSGYLEAPDSEEAVAAIEVLAKLLGKGTQSDTFTEEVDTWVDSIKHRPDIALLQKAQRTLDRILSKDSELLDLWAEADETGAWKSSMANLRQAMDFK
jgi:hypothetical protein